MRRCVSYSDLANRRRLGRGKEPEKTSCEISALDDAQPLKRSRSDQSLPAVILPATSIAEHPDYPQDDGNQLHDSLHISRSNSQGLQRVQRAPALPVVLSDVGSSTSSLLSLDLALPSSASQQHLAEQPSNNPAAVVSTSVGSVQPAAEPYSPLAPSQWPLSPSEADLVTAYGKRSYGALYSLANVSSAASLTAAQYTGVGAATLDRTASDASISSGGGQSYLAGLQQLVPPLPPYSPPPLFSPGPPVLPSAAKLLASPREAGAGWYANSSSIQQQKQSVFKAPATTARSSSSGFVLAASQGWSASNHGRGVPSISSVDSITSVEAGEHLLGFEYGPAGGSPVTMQPVHQLTGGAATRGGDVVNISRADADQRLAVSQSQQQHSTVEPTAIGADDPTRVVTHAAANDQPPSSVSPRQPGSRQQVSTAQLPPLSPQQQQSGNTLSTRSSVQSPGPLLELQTVSSMLGCEGEQLLLPEQSTGVIDPFSPFAVAQLLQTAAAAAAAKDGVLVPLADQRWNSSSDSAPAHTAATAGAGTQLQSVNMTKGSAGFSKQRTAAGGTTESPFATSTAVVAAGPHAAGIGFGKPDRPVPVAVSSALPAVSSSAMIVGFGSSSSTAAAAAPSMPAFGFKSAAAAIGPAAAVYGGQGAAAAAAAAKAFAPGPTSAFASQHATSNGSSSSRDLGQETLDLSSWQSSSSNPVRASSALLADDSGRMSALPLGRPPSAQSSAGTREGGSSWNFARRPASFDCSQPSGSGRRRGSLELNMPWRSKLDAVIAQVTADALDTQAPLQQVARSAGSGTSISTVGGSSAEGVGLHDNPFSLFAEPPDLNLRRHSSRGGMLQGLGSGMLLPLLESDQEQQIAGLAEAEAEGEDLAAELPAKEGQHADSTGNGHSASSSGASDDTSITSASASYRLPTGSLLGGYVGASDITRGTSTSLSELETARSYGLEFDGAVVLQSVELGSTRELWSEGMELLAGVHLQQDQEQEEELDGPDLDRLLSQASAAELNGLSEQQQQQLANLGSPPVESRLRLGPTSRKQPVGAASSRQQATLPLGDGQTIQHRPGSSAQQQLQQELQQMHRSVSQHLPEIAEAAQQLAPAASADLAHELARASSFSSSISSISTRSSVGLYARRGAGSSSSSAAYELFVRLNRARQTLDFAKRQAEMFAELDRAELGVWDALDMLNGLREYEAVLLSGVRGSGRTSSSSGGEDNSTATVLRNSFSDGGVAPDMSLKEHALQVAELCRLSFPDKPWMALVGLLHGLGKLLAHPIWGNQPQWAVAGESYPVGCKFAPQISHSEFFSANPDRRRRAYSTALGVYSAGCGLRNVYMSWGAPEYMYMLLVLNQTDLPEEALFMIRYQRCLALTRPGGAYRQLMSESDKNMLPLLAAFQGLVAFRRVQLPPEALKGEELVAFYDKLIAQYLGEAKLFW